MQRIKWIDSCKGVGILLVILGHMMCIGSEYRIEHFLDFSIYSFHMAFFFILSGITFNSDKQFSIFIKNKCSRLLLPYLFFCVMDTVTDYLKYKEFQLNGKLINTLLFTCQSKFSGLWFFIVLFVTSILLYGIEKYISRQWIQISIIIILIILNRVCFYRNIYLPFSLEECFLALPFMYVGSKTKLLFKYEKIIFLISVLTWCISFGIHMALGYASISLWNSDVQNVILYLLQGFCASYVLIFMVKYICSKTKISILEKLGNETAFMYGIHYYFLSMWLIVIEKK